MSFLVLECSLILLWVRQSSSSNFLLSSLFGFVPVLLEAGRTGAFCWHFHRDYALVSDAYDVVLVLVFMFAFAAYFALPLMKGSQTVGCWFCASLQLTTMGMSSGFLFRARSADFQRSSEA